MRRLAATGFRAVLVGVGLALAAAPAYAADETTIAHVEPTKNGLQILVSVPVGTQVDLSEVTATIDGRTAEASAVRADSTTSVRRTAVLAIDTSNSMKGPRFAAAKAAALQFLETVPDDVYVGIVSFADEVTEALPPTLDRDTAQDVVGGLTLSQRTRLYDGILAGVRMAGSDGQRSLLVLSDGADTSDTPLSAATKAVTDSETLVTVVSLEQSAAAKAALDELAEAGNGKVVDAGEGALSEVLSQEADALARQILVTAQVPDSVPGTDATVEVALSADGQEVSASAFAPIRADEPAAPKEDRSPAPAADSSRSLSPSMMYAGLVALGLGLLAALVLLVPSRARPLSPEERAVLYAERATGRAASGADLSTADPLATFKGAADKMLRSNRSFEARIERRLDGAGNPLKPSEWLLLDAGVFIAAGTLGVLLSNGNLLVGLLFLVAGAIGPWVWLGVKRKRRRKAFNASLPEVLQLMSGSLAAGLSLAQSVDTIVREGVEPISSEFKRVLMETRLGVSLEDSLEGVGERFESKDFGWVVMAIKIQRQVGGNLAELLDTVAATMREREYIRRQVATLAAEGKLSAWVLGGLPPAFMLYLLLANRDYVMVMFTDPRGWAMLAGSALWLGIGVFWMSRLVKVEV